MNKKEDFLREYEALCRKFNLFVHFIYDDGPYHLKTLLDERLEDATEGATPADFWFQDHMKELRESDVDLDTIQNEMHRREMAKYA